MKVRSLLFSTLCMLAISVTFTSCSDDDDAPWNDEGTKVELPQRRMFILNEGKADNNNAGIAFYAPNRDANDSNNNFIANIYFKQNEKQLGDTGQDILEYEDNIYVIVSGSSLLLKLNAAAVEEARLSFSSSDGQPRYMAAKDGKIYVTLWSGKVARIDSRTMKIEAYVDVNANPEQIVENEGKLYVANSGYGEGTDVSVIDLNTFKKEKDIPVVKNPNRILESNDEVYLLSWGIWTNVLGEGYTFQRIKSDDTVESIAVASAFAEHDDTIFLIYSDWKSDGYEHIFSTYNTKTHKLTEGNFLKNAPQELLLSSIYGFNIDPETGEFYISTSDYVSNGDIYRFKKDGTFAEKFDCGGINPSKMIFLQ